MILVERLTINGNPVDIAGYQIDAPTDGMGQSVSIVLAKPDLTLIPIDADIKFEIGAGKYNSGTDEIDYSWAPPIIEGGRLFGRNYSVRWIPDDMGGFPGDALEFSSMSPLADKLSKVPYPPVILVDPATVSDPATLIPPAEQRIAYRGGDMLTTDGLITPVVRTEHDLKIIRVMDIAYREGCGFTRVVSNLPAFKVDRVDFTLESGYHDPIKSLIQNLEPMAFENEGELWVIDPEDGLPPGLTVINLPLDCVVEVIQNLNPEPLVNAIVLHCKANGTLYGGEIPQNAFITEPPIESGEGKSYTRTEVTRHVTNFVDTVSGEIRRTEEHEIVTKVYAYQDRIEVTVTNEGQPDQEVTRVRLPGEVVLISEETLSNRYVGNTKQGHTRSVDATYADPGNFGRITYGNVYKETGRQIYGADEKNPGESILQYSEVISTGAVLKETKPDGLIVYTPILDADSGNLVESDKSQSLLLNQPLETMTETLQPTSQNQSNVVTRIVDHLKGGVRGSIVQGRPGSTSTFAPPLTLTGGYRAGYTRELLIDAESVAEHGLRRPIQFDAGYLDKPEAKRRAYRKLARLKNPPKRYSITLPGIMFALRRGSLVVPPLRVGQDNKCIVTGYRITGSALGTPNARRQQVLDVKELIND